MTALTFLVLREQFEEQLSNSFELLELHYTPYSFGSGLTSYRIKGHNIKIVYDGRGNEVQILVSAKHDKYPDVSWTEIFIGSPTDFIEKGISKLKASLQISEKTYSVEKIREVHKQAYAPWTKEDDQKLELLYCEGKKIKELAQLFNRKDGAISSRIKKLELKEKYGH